MLFTFSNCQFAHSPASTRKTDKFPYLGENLWITSASGARRTARALNNSIRSWHNEVNVCYNKYTREKPLWRCSVMRSKDAAFCISKMQHFVSRRCNIIHFGNTILTNTFSRIQYLLDQFRFIFYLNTSI